tara:strand:+ start:312 stop:1145 length:834 start_codon:yes stop_codon:yes gene_type:complete
MKILNSLSGGKTSSYIAANYKADYNVFSLVRIEDCKFKDEKIRLEVEDRLQAPFIGTAEDDEIIYTMLDLEQYIGRPISWTTGETFEKIIENHGGYLPNKMARYCTTDLKTMPILKWIYKEIGEPVFMRFGFRANETSRAKNMLSKVDSEGYTIVKATFEKHADGRNKWVDKRYCKPEFPLIKDGIFKDKIEAFWKGKTVRFAYMNNCAGCHWRSPLLIKHMSNKLPDKIKWFADQEKKGGGTWRSDCNYSDVIKWKTQLQLFDTDFNECDSGYCGI